MIGTTLGQWRILKRLGQGGMGEVYLAEDTRLSRKVALKFLPPALWHEPEAQERLRREAQSASRLDHPNIVTIFGIEEFDGRPFIHMAHVPGVTLGEYTARERRSIPQVLELALQIANGLAHAHAAGVVHRDLKLSNVLVDDAGRARILDFGIATQQGASRMTMTGFTIGTLAFTAPEIVGGKESTPASDLYSFGVVLYQMLTGRLPHEADHDAALLYAILHTPPEPPIRHRSDLPADVQRIAMKCLEKSPEKRYADATALIADLRAALAGGAKPAVAERERPSIAVLPFANMSADPENEFFSDGLTEELLNVLAKNPELKVTGRTSSFAFKGKLEDLRDIGQRLGVATLLEGSVRKAGSRVRITAQLVQASDGFHLWSETYDRVIDDIFAVQDDIAQAVSKALDVKLLGRAAGAPKMDSKDYALFLRARHLSSQNTASACEKALAIFDDLLTRLPTDARLYAGLAFVFLVQAGFGFADARASSRRARETAERALELDPQLADAHSVIGWVLMQYERRWDEAGEAFRRAVALAPGASEPLMGLASWHANHGELDEAIRMGMQVIELEPLSALDHAFVARFEMWAGRYRESKASFDRALELSPDLTSARSALGLVHVLDGDGEGGLRIIEGEKSGGYRACAQAIAFHLLGRSRESDEALARLRSEGKSWNYQIAMAHAARGEFDETFQSLDRALELVDSGLASILATPVFRPLYGDPRWPRVLAKIGVAPKGASADP